MVKKLLVGWDVDGTLIDQDDKPRKDIIQLVHLLEPYCDILVWSGGGQQYAEMWGNRLNLPESVIYASKTANYYPDVAFDDSSDFTKGHVLVRV